MAKHILWNSKLNEYTMREEVDGVKSVNPKPQKYSVEDKWADYRRKAKEEMEE